MTPIAFPAVGQPTVSVVVLTYGGWEFVRGALEALAAHTPPCYEVILIDNASPDGTADQLARHVEGATFIANTTNVGFGGGANQGALLARGRYLCFLNSDAFVQAGWLPPLLARLDDDPMVAAVAPCVLDPDGTLQEAGGITGGDGWAGQLGLGADAADWDFRFAREADYASAVCLVVRRSAFEAVGGFDPAYGVGYFEDVDLCYALWDRGLATVYEPQSRVVHLRGASSGEQAQAYAIASQAVFARRWADVIARRPRLGDPDVRPALAAAARDARTADRILVACGSLDAAAGLLDDLTAAAPHARLSVLAETPFDPAELLARGVEVAPWDGRPDWLARRRFHWSVVIGVGPDGLAPHRALLEDDQPQALRLHLVRALDFRMVEPGGQGDAAPHLLADLAARGARFRRAEERSIAMAHAVLCVTEEEARLVQVLAPATPAYRVPPTAPADGLTDDTLAHLRADVLPRLAADDSNDAAAAGAAADDSNDAAAAGAAADDGDLLVAPVRAAWGPVPALVAAIEAAVPFVTTPVGAAGLGLGADLSALVVGDGPDGVADRARVLLADESVRGQVRNGLAALAGAQHSPEVRRHRWRKALAEVGVG